MTSETIVSVCIRHQVAGIAIVENGTVFDFARRYLRQVPPGESRSIFAARAVARLAAQCGADRIVLERGDSVIAELAEAEVSTMGIREAKERLLPASRRTHRDLLERLTAELPGLNRLLRTRPDGHIVETSGESIAVHLAVAIGLAWTQTHRDRATLPPATRYSPIPTI